MRTENRSLDVMTQRSLLTFMSISRLVRTKA